MTSLSNMDNLLRELIEEQKKTNKLLGILVLEVSKEDIRNKQQKAFPGITPFLFEILYEFMEKE